MRRARFSGGLGLFLLLGAGLTSAQPPELQEPDVKAAFVYNFLKFVEWPEKTFETADQPLVVGILGNGRTADATAALLESKRLNTRPLVVRRLRWDEPLDEVHAVFVGDADALDVRQLVDTASRGPILVVGDSRDFATEGGTIGLVVERQKVRFEINTAAAAHSQLKISSKLLALARTVHRSISVVQP